MSSPILYPFVEHKCGQLFAWSEEPWALMTYGPPETVDDFLRVSKNKACPSCGRRVTETLESTGYYRLEFQRSWWRPWTWLWSPEMVIVEQTAAAQS